MNKTYAVIEGKWEIEFIQFFCQIYLTVLFSSVRRTLHQNMGNFEDIRICWGFSLFGLRSAFGRKCSVRWLRLPPRLKGMISMWESNLTCCFSFGFLFTIRVAKGCIMIDILLIKIFR